MAKKPDEPITITEASHRVPCSVKFLRNHVRRGNITEHRLPTRHLIFYEAEIEQARLLLYGTRASKKPSKKRGNGR
jgi:hypothetical protein